MVTSVTVYGGGYMIQNEYKARVPHGSEHRFTCIKMNVKPIVDQNVASEGLQNIQNNVGCQ